MAQNSHLTNKAEGVLILPPLSSSVLHFLGYYGCVKVHSRLHFIIYLFLAGPYNL